MATSVFTTVEVLGGERINLFGRLQQLGIDARVSHVEGEEALAVVGGYKIAVRKYDQFEVDHDTKPSRKCRNFDELVSFLNANV